MVSHYRDVWVKDDLLSPCSLATGMAQARGLLVLGMGIALGPAIPRAGDHACLLAGPSGMSTLDEEVSQGMD